MPSLYLLPLSVFICRKALAFVNDVRAIHRIKLKRSEYEKYGWDVLSEVSVIGPIVFALADADVIKEVTSSSVGRFIKPVEVYERLEIRPPHHLCRGSEMEEIQEACITCIYRAQQQTGIQRDEVWRDKATIEFDHCTSLTYKIALLVLGAAVFGNKASWEIEPGLKPGHRMTFNQALHGMTSDFYLRVVVTAFAMGLTERLRKAQISYEELGAHLSETLEEKKNSPDPEGTDLFSIILANNEDSDDRLTDAEVKGNIFIFLIAGHETTAHTLAFTFALLSMYPDEQEALYKHITSVLEGRLVPSYGDLPRLARCTAVLYETMRVFPPVSYVKSKVCGRGYHLDITNRSGEKKTIPIPKGSTLTVDAAGLHYKPQYWKDPLAFKPERFLEAYRRDAFIPFSSGPRAFPGRRFFETEAITVMAMFISRYKVSIKEEPQFSSETFEQRYERIFASKEVLTLTPTRVPLVFTKRV
ncbi:cytochrome P450 [Coprinopsis marcescibilis]|uniref:Cytochrome P450 n=1 Tax=Coprinopsis marcescibilis TaxID=230819 RepID=A0A5C3L4J0_COPMA|nr:cytochrome P450 [Coprinopsis marcescibilis]